MPNSSDKVAMFPKPLHDMNEKELRIVFKGLDAAQLEHHRYLDYTKMRNFRNAALYTPALSKGYIDNVARLAKQQQEAVNAKNPTADPFYELMQNSDHTFGADDLKFINPKSRLFFYPWVLYSGGQGAATDAMANKDNWVTSKPRDPRVVVQGDSGGFQLQQQTIPFDPKTTPERMLRWLERIADQSMILDFPTGGIATGAMVPHVNELIRQGIDVQAQADSAGFSTGFMTCLLLTQQNIDYFALHRVAGATNLLNVIQGRNEEESRYWYEGVKHYKFEGWAFAGKHSVQLSLTLRRLIQMKQDGLLKPDQWIHFLGVSTLKVGVALTYIQRALRKYTDAKNVQITFDSKSPIDSVIHGYQAVTGYDLSNDKWSIHSEPTNLKANSKSDVLLYDISANWVNQSEHRRRAQSTLAHVIKLSDLVGTVNPKTGKRVPSAFQQALLIHHNTQAFIEAFRYAYRYLDEKYEHERPPSIQFLDTCIDLVFQSKNPFDVIDDIAPELDALAMEGYFGR